MRNDEFWGNSEPAGFGPELDLLRRAHGLGNKVVTGETEVSQGVDRGAFIVPVAFSAARRERVAGHKVAILKSAFRLVA